MTDAWDAINCRDGNWVPIKSTVWCLNANQKHWELRLRISIWDWGKYEQPESCWWQCITHTDLHPSSRGLDNVESTCIHMPGHVESTLLISIGRYRFQPQTENVNSRFEVSSHFKWHLVVVHKCKNLRHRSLAGVPNRQQFMKFSALSYCYSRGLVFQAFD